MSSSPTEPGGDALVALTMPQMGVSVVEGTVAEWRKQAGDWVERDEIICSIATDKIDTDVESPASGRIAEIVVEVGTTVEVGVVLARIATDATPGEAHAVEGNGSARPAAADAPQVPSSESDPAAGEASEAAAALGDHPASPTAPPLDAATGAGGSEGAASTAAGTPATKASDEAAPAATSGVPASPGSPPTGGARHYSPVVQRIAAEHGIDLAHVEGTGRDGRVRKPDVLAHVEAQAGDATAEPPMHIESPYRPDPSLDRPRRSRTGRPAAAAAPPPAPPIPVVDATDPGPTTVAPLSRMRQAIGSRMLESLQTAATCTTVMECDMHRVQAARKAKALTYLPYVARATVEALQAFPQLNATLQEGQLTSYESIHLGIAVSLGTGGLIVPVIHHAQEYSVEGLAHRITELAEKARANALTHEDVRGATFTITNPGAYGALIATPVINQPQVAILDSEAVVKRPVVVTDASGADAIAIRPMTCFCMSWDHRALDGVLAAQFLAAIRARLEAWGAGT